MRDQKGVGGHFTEREHHTSRSRGGLPFGRGWNRLIRRVIDPCKLLTIFVQGETLDEQGRAIS
jgi:hypothetical protein